MHAWFLKVTSRYSCTATHSVGQRRWWYRWSASFPEKCLLLKFVICFLVHVFINFFMIMNMSLLLGQNKLSGDWCRQCWKHSRLILGGWRYITFLAAWTITVEGGVVFLSGYSWDRIPRGISRFSPSFTLYVYFLFQPHQELCIYIYIYIYILFQTQQEICMYFLF
jgi:hypothetical protein